MELLVVFAVIGIIIVSLMPMVHRTREQARRLECADNLRRIAVALYKCAVDNDGKFPVDLAALYPKYIDNVKYFICPSDIDASEISPQGFDIDVNSSYIYASGWTMKDPLDTVLLSDKNYIIDKDSNHNGAGGNVIYLSGEVRWVDTKDWVNPIDKE